LKKKLLYPKSARKQTRQSFDTGRQDHSLETAKVLKAVYGIVLFYRGHFLLVLVRLK